jgi:hypothetical protein
VSLAHQQPSPHREKQNGSSGHQGQRTPALAITVSPMRRSDLAREVFFSRGSATLLKINLAVFVIDLLPLRLGDFSVSYGYVTYNLFKQSPELLRLHSSAPFLDLSSWPMQFSCHAYRYKESKHAVRHG